jgi:ketosteroid isomerase-like protein
MSEENVELVRSLQPAPETDLAALFRDDATWEAAREGLGAVFDPDCESAIVMPGSGDAATRRTYRGVDGLRDAWLDWLAPWESYHVRIERLLDAGERVVVLPRDRGRRRGMEAEIESPVAAIWTVRDGRVIRAEFYASRDQALLDAGLRD